MTAAKRVFDLVFAGLLVIFFAPLIAGLIAWLLIRQGRPVFYVSDRMKTDSEVFRLWKFRTMTLSESDAGVTGGYKAARITPAGAFLRASRLDELPQLWNILRGDLSFVGPRPPLPEYVRRFPQIYREVLQCRPGVTGLATLVYHKHETELLARCKTQEETDAMYAGKCVPAKARLDIIYKTHRNLCFDCDLILQTIGGIFRRG